MRKYVGLILTAVLLAPFALVPFSAETNFMSLEGYQRWLHYQQTGSW